jgi:putative mycofactocin binding protein MftB
MAFALDRGWTLAPGVALRPEPFGALVYDFDTRRLSFLKSRKLLNVVSALGTAASARDACAAAGVTETEIPAYSAALATLADRGMITTPGAV